MKEIIDSIRLQIHERLSSPLFGSLLLAWIGWNHRFLTVLFSNLPVKERFDIIDNQLYATDWDKWGKALVCPVVTALLFILVYPYPAKWLYGYWHRRQREQKEIRDQIEAATLLTVEESLTIRKEVYRIQVERDETIRRLQSENRSLRNSLKEKPNVHELTDEELTPLIKSAPTQPPTPEIPDGTLKIIGILAKNNGRMKEYQLFELLKEPQVRMDHYVDVGTQLLLIRKTQRDVSAPTFLELTEKGRELAVQAKYV
jgi:hypothetical protein